jgi:carbonic anhydrase/acetyltransferase-like protein (isoleucine patch superfamily)
MAIYKFDERTPVIGAQCYVADSAEVIGDVTLGTGCYVGPGAVIRGDYGKIVIGDHCGIEENVVIHARPDDVCTLGNWVTLGHGCIVHTAALIDDYAVIGMGAVVSDWARVGKYAAVGEGAVVRNKQVLEDGAIGVGIPCKVIGQTSPEWRGTWVGFKKRYVEFAHTYRNRLVKIG